METSGLFLEWHVVVKSILVPSPSFRPIGWTVHFFCFACHFQNWFSLSLSLLNNHKKKKIIGIFFFFLPSFFLRRWVEAFDHSDDVWNIQIPIAARESVKKQTEKNVNKKKAQRRKWKDVRGGRRRPLLLCIEPRIKKKWGDDEERKEIHVYTCTQNLQRSHDGRPCSPMINRSPLLHNRLVISHEYIRLHVEYACA